MALIITLERLDGSRNPDPVLDHTTPAPYAYTVMDQGRILMAGLLTHTPEHGWRYLVQRMLNLTPDLPTPSA